MSEARCIALLGGSFDPVHNGHLALGSYFGKLLVPDELRVIPAGQPWQKQGLQTAPAHRAEMARLAFGQMAVPVVIDEQEIRREGATYTIDTLRALRDELGPRASITLLIGADQLQQLQTWKDWRALFNYANICAASRPGFSMDAAHVAPEVAQEFARRAATPAQIRGTPAGLAYLATNLAVDISATQIRAALERGADAGALIPAGVLDYIKQHHLYGN
ncbi:nicotinate-nucleotide adenylyltransferase [Noviherbaspirillum sp.]|uniref:nicotinate-nucleotide adenylyltransferase n=1 Tax=Noviherbaspirillum sp. TaxID=1926288 RepID=UPI0039C8F839